MPSRPHPHHGFTLLELLVVCACVALLGSWAMTSYAPLMQRSQRTQARVALLQAAHWLERAASVQGRYPDRRDIPASVLQATGLRYQLSVSSDAHSFVLRATPLGAQSSDPCGTLTLNHQNKQGVENAQRPASTCWGH